MVGRGIIRIFAVLILLGGIGVLVFPHIAQRFSEREARRVIAEFEQEVYRIADDSLRSATASTENSYVTYFDELYAAMQAYNQNIYENKQQDLKDAFSYQVASFDLTEWGFHENIVGYIDMPRMKVKLPIYLGATAETLSKGAGHLTQTSLPIGGENTNCVLAAHRGMSTAAMFRDIEKLQIGDELTITNFRETLIYHVADIKVIKPTDIHEILIQDGRDLVTLITCHPYRHNYQRYAVFCERVIDRQ